MSSRSHSAHNSESENESADSVDHPIGERSIEVSDSELSENSDSDRQVSEPSENSGSDRQLSEPSGDPDSDGQVSEPSENADSDLQDSEASDNSDSGCQVSETSENSDSDRRRGKRKRHLSLVSDESSPKRRRRRKPAVDLITALPDSLLLHVLSFLPIEDAVKAQVLSKRWQYLWTCLTSLDFRFGDRPDKCNSDFVTFVDKTLLLCNCSKIKKLGVQFEYECSSESNVNLWTRFAAVKGAEELQLDFDGAQDDYWLPQLLYTNSSFKTLQFNACWVRPEKVCWNSLKKLSIGYSRLSEDVIQKILVGSPVLEILELYYFYGFNRLHVRNASVKKLILRDVWDDWDEGEEEFQIDSGRYHYLLEISAPHLHSLEISGDLRDKICQLGDVSSLVDANLSFHELDHSFDLDVYELYQNMLKDLLQSLVHVKKIT